MNFRRLFPLLLALAGCAKPDGAAQISIEQFATIGGPADNGGFEGFTLVSPLLSGGRRVAFGPNPPGSIPLVVDSTGRVIDTLATLGDGPGQVRRASRVYPAQGDTIVVVDQMKVSLFTADGGFIRSFPTTIFGVWGGAVTGAGDLVLAPSTSGSPEIATAYSLATGERRWGAPVPAGPRSRLDEVRSVAVAPDGSIWLARVMGRVEFEHYSAEGARLGVVTPEVSWYPPYERYQMPTRTTPASPTISGFWIDSLDRAWVVGVAVDPRWAEAEGEDLPMEGGVSYFRPRDPADRVDGVLEVFDLKTGRSVASLRTDSLMGQVVEPWILQKGRTDADGWMQVDLFRVVPRF
jgi:hypothetical protein